MPRVTCKSCEVRGLSQRFTRGSWHFIYLRKRNHCTLSQFYQVRVLMSGPIFHPCFVKNFNGNIAIKRNMFAFFSVNSVKHNSQCLSYTGL